ncbi:Mindy4 [Symbiodinium sp. KB8]|nr:Mindy4 [Symbiodinium sp. KB8]
MVNLMMFGRAYSNVFNGEKVLADDTGASTDQIVLRGVPFQSEIGFLTLFEHYKSIEVGSFFKNPRYPVWVVCSESHYSVLFGLDPALTKGIPSKAFDLYYYDPLGKQEEVYRLTVDPHPQPPPDPEQLNSIHNPPIDHVIRTRWPGAVVDWNGSEALL